MNPWPAFLDERDLFYADARGDTLVLSDGLDVHEVEPGPLAPRLCRMLASSRRVFVFDDAKPALGALLRRGTNVSRPVCLSTLAKLAHREPTPAPLKHRADVLAERSAAVKAVGHQKVARLECLVLPAFAALEHFGLPLDVARWRTEVKRNEAMADEARSEVFDHLDHFVGRDLFGAPDLALENDAATKAVLERMLDRTLPDISKRLLRELEHPVGEALVRFREHNKIVSTYGERFLAQADADGRLRATFVPLGASTGRVASRDPNLQNLPSSDAFHDCVRAPEGRALVTADYATCELRILAELSGDEAFLDAFARGDDLHAVVASRMFKTTVSKAVRPELRARAKAINFGLMYGMGAEALGRQVGVSRRESDRLLDQYFSTFPQVKNYLNESVEQAKAQGYAETVLGRRLYFDAEALADDERRGEWARVAKNMPIQGTSADMTKLAMLRVHEALLKAHPSASLVNTVHDELVVECDADEGNAVGLVLEKEMGDAHRTLLHNVPPLVDVHVGETWGH